MKLVKDDFYTKSRVRQSGQLRIKFNYIRYAIRMVRVQSIKLAFDCEIYSN